MWGFQGFTSISDAVKKNAYNANSGDAIYIKLSMLVYSLFITKVN